MLMISTTDGLWVEKKSVFAQTQQNSLWLEGAGTFEEIHPLLPARDISGWATEIGEFCFPETCKY